MTAGFVVFILAIFFSGIVIGSENPYLCNEGISNEEGAIIPRRDLYLRTEGPSVKLTCNFNPDGSFAKQGATIDDVVIRIKTESTLFHFQKQNQNETSVVYEFSPTSPGLYIVECVVKVKESLKGLCTRHIYVGHPPDEPQEFQCISANWVSLNCTWKTLPNAIATNQTVFYSEDGRYMKSGCCHQLEVQCLSLDSGGNETIQTTHYAHTESLSSYPKDERSIRVEICRENSLSDGTPNSWNFSIPLYTIVRPDPPVDLKVVENEPRSLTITYNIPTELEFFPPGLISRIFWWSELDPTQRQFDTTDFEVNDSNFTFTLDDLFPGIFYNITVELLSARADPEDSRLWSEKREVGIRTLSERPEFAPETTQGSFESLVHLNNRHVWVYWKYPGRQYHNGVNFRPRITEVLEKDKPIGLTPNKMRNSYANFQNISLNQYSIFVTSENENGTAPESSKVVIPYHTQIKGLRPKSVTKIAYDHHSFQLFEMSWLPPDRASEVRNYTIFFCKPESGRDRPYQCDGPLDWVTVNSSILIKNITLPTTDLYQFAVAANADHGISSGMIWATCTILSNKVVSKLKNVKVTHVRQTHVEVEWMVDCSDRHVLAYKVSYCVMGSPDPDEPCSGENKFVNTTATSKNAVLADLKPYTYYKLCVSAITRAGESEASDPEVVRTKPAKPEGKIVVSTEVQSDNSISLSCGKPEIPNGEIDGYRIKYGFMNLEGYEQIVSTSAVLPSCELAEINGLMHNVEYFIQVSACNSLEHRMLCGSSTKTQVTTLVGPSSRMPAPEVKTPTAENMEIYWYRNQFFPGSDKLSYKIQITNTIRNESFVKETNAQDQVRISLPEHLLPDCKSNYSLVTVYNVSIMAISIDPDTNRTFPGEWSPVKTVSVQCFSDLPVLTITWIVVGIVVLVLGSFAVKWLLSRSNWNSDFFKSVKDAPISGDFGGDDTCVISSALAPRPDQQKKYQRTESKESAQTLLIHPKRNLSGESTSTSGCESARSSEMDEIEKAGTGDTASIETTEEESPESRANFQAQNDSPNYQPQVGWPVPDDVPSGLGYSKVGVEPNQNPLQQASSPPPPPGGSYVAIQDLKAPKPNSGYIAFNQVAKSQRRPHEPLSMNSEDMEAPMAYSKVGIDPNANLSTVAPSSGYIPHPVVTKPKRLVTLPVSEVPLKSDPFKTTPYVSYGGPVADSPIEDAPSRQSAGPYFQMSSTKPHGVELKVTQPDITMSPKNLKVSTMAPFNTAVTALDSSKSSMV